MGGSGSSRQEYLSSNKSLNLSTAGNSINTAPSQLVTAIPVAVSMQDSVGLFGAENRYIKLDRISARDASSCHFYALRDW